MKNSKFYINFAITWTFVESIIALSGIQEWNSAILRGIFVLVFGLALLSHVREKKLNNERYFSGDELQSNVAKSINRGLSYLTKENKNINGQRMRLTPSIMESATVIGAIYLASDILKKKTHVKQTTLDWLFGSLKKQFRDQVPVKYFDCSRCNKGIVCNVAYFDYLSHFYYAKNTKLYERFVNEFSFLKEVLKNRLIQNEKKYGWPLFEENEIDSLATSTNLILCSAIDVLTESQEKQILKSLLALQRKHGNKIGSWHHNPNDTRWCSGELEIITTHRAIECLSIYKNKFTELTNTIQESIINGIDFLKSCHGSEVPVNYEHQMGIEEEILRGNGHIVQAMINADLTDSFLIDRVNQLVNSQSTNGAFVGKSEHFGEPREIINKTDLTAFIIRTLCMYYKKDL